MFFIGRRVGLIFPTLSRIHIPPKIQESRPDSKFSNFYDFLNLIADILMYGVFLFQSLTQCVID